MIENEIKIVLRPDLANRIDDYPQLVNGRFITQGYHVNGGRIRRDSYADGSGSTFTFNYKIDLPTNDAEEFEVEIDQASFDRCLPLCVSYVTKKRFTVHQGGAQWDLDLFSYSTGVIEFVMVECEMAPGSKLPLMDQWPTFVIENLLLVVPQDDLTFSSRRLGDPDYMRAKLKHLGLEYS